MLPDGCSFTLGSKQQPGAAAQLLQQRIEAHPNVTLVREGLARSVSQTGETYELFHFVHGTSEADAISAIEVEISEYLERHGGTLYWRAKPEVAGMRNRWTAYARLLLSDRPENSVASVDWIDIAQRLRSHYELLVTGPRDVRLSPQECLALVDLITTRHASDA